MKLKQQQGISLIELLIAMALGSILLIGLISLYASNKNTYQMTQAAARLQEDGRIAIQIMSRDIRMAGYVGCGKITDIKIYPDDYYAEKSFVGWHDKRSSSKIQMPAITKPLKPNTDALFVLAADPYVVTVKSMTEHSMRFNEKSDFDADDSVMISDCQRADIFKYDKKDFQYIYKAGAQASRWQKLFYYLAKTTRIDKTGKPIYALYRRDLNSKSRHIELVDGVEDMQISFSDGASYVGAEQVKDWSLVRAVKIDLLLVSKMAVNDAPQRYVFAGKQYQAPDRRLYSAWQTVIALRERIS